mmetsp:Transcript_61244/g.149922  ORF Transcript_61244/g.149922 Transcript_61244/m.149922 type:complete len:547 (-) Transcript_61244:102-1742(-)
MKLIGRLLFLSTVLQQSTIPSSFGNDLTKKQNCNGSGSGSGRSRSDGSVGLSISPSVAASPSASGVSMSIAVVEAFPHHPLGQYQSRTTARRKRIRKTKVEMFSASTFFSSQSHRLSRIARTSSPSPSSSYMPRGKTTRLAVVKFPKGGGQNGDDETDDSNQPNIRVPPSSVPPGDARAVDSTTVSQPSSSAAAVFRGRLLLVVVAVLYGTLNVSLRLVYQSPGELVSPPTASELSTVRGWMAAFGFLPLLSLNGSGSSSRKNNKEIVSASDENPCPTVISEDTSNSAAATTTDLLQVGLELAVWNFLSQGLLNVGLLTTSSARASFLTQTSVVLTPVISSVWFGDKVPKKVWLASVIALCGLIVLTLASSPATATATAARSSGGTMYTLSFISTFFSSFNTGDVLVLFGALSWSAYLCRLSKIGSKFNDINLQFVKTTLLAVLYSAWAFVSITATVPSTTDPFGWLWNGMTFGVLLYSAFGPGTIADILQQRGQKYTTASEANIILSMEPICAAVSAWLVLGETTSIQEIAGGVIILAAALIAST